ncbi:MAG: OmpA family protein [Candidatus Kapabacteria bacterium]|nr:OmpA family protein [Ignavibacteriota bacterium]MCW5885272.1 OmpA family protein [Candidatus Kapabacteria bacterium]
MLRKYYYILLFIICSPAVFSQAPLGELQYFNMLSGGDTLRVQRQYGTWWYGLQGGMVLNHYFGNLNVGTINQPNNPFNPLHTYETASGGGFFFGGVLEWKPPGEYWSGMLTLNFFDRRAITASIVPYRDSSFDVNSTYNQITISPSVKYHLPVEGLHANIGMIFELMLNHEGAKNLKYVNTGKVQHEYLAEFTKPFGGLGVTLGFGYDFYVGDYKDKARFLLTPFADFNIRSSIVNDNDSYFYSTFARFGFQIKYGNDIVQLDTLWWDPTYDPPPYYIASTRNDEGVLYVSTMDDFEFPTARLDYIEVSQVSAEIAEVIPDKIDTAKSVAAELPKPKPEPQKSTQQDQIAKKREIVIRKGVTETFTYPTSPSIQTTGEIKSYLDKVAEYLAANPTARVIIIGHSDTRGNLEQNATRAMERAKNVEKYLLSVGVPQGSIIASWKGSLFSVAPNDTEEGRRQNRRVEILIE